MKFGKFYLASFYVKIPIILITNKILFIDFYKHFYKFYVDWILTSFFIYSYSYIWKYNVYYPWLFIDREYVVDSVVLKFYFLSELIF